MRYEQRDAVAAEENRQRQINRLAKRAAKKKRRKQRKALQKQQPKSPTAKQKPAWKRSKAFYSTPEWKRLRYDVLKEGNGRCCLCGVSAHDGARLNVDHIKPVKTHPHLRLDKSNVQVLCGSCNAGKGNRDDTDWREPAMLEYERLTIPWDRFEKF